MGKKLNSATMMAVTQSKRCHENDETESVRRVRCRVVNEGSSKQIVAQIVTELQVTMLKPWRGRPHVYVVVAQLSLCTDVDSQLCTSTDPDLSCLVVTATFASKLDTIFIMVVACRWFGRSPHAGSRATVT